MIVKLNNVIEKFHLDIVTGDLITPGAIEYNYKSLLTETKVNLWAYNLETVLAEKIETILSRAESTGRMKDYYYVYLLYTLGKSKIDNENLRKAIENTFRKRHFFPNYDEILKNIENSDDLNSKWILYVKKNKYANSIEFIDTIVALKKIIEIIDLVEV